MTDAQNNLKEVLTHIAKEQGFEDYETELTPIYSGGANYTSQLFSITLSAPGKDDLKLFAKVAAMGEKIRSMTTLQVFETEIMFYTKIVTKYRDFEERYNFPEEVRLVLPKYYGGSTEYLKESLVLEELTAVGYQNFDRFKCFDWEYASQCVSVLARLHALSVAYQRDEPEEFEAMVQKLAFQFPAEEMKGFMERGITNALESTVEEHREKLAKFLEKNMTEESFGSYYNPQRKVVLVHGDFRPSNILHKTDEQPSIVAVAENVLTEVLANIAKEQGYEDYETEIEGINSGGANYWSRLFCVLLTAPGKDDFKLFAKVGICIGRKDALMRFLDTEIGNVLHEIVGKVTGIGGAVQLPEKIRVVMPKYYGGSTEYLKETIVREELTAKGYESFDRFKFVDWEYASQRVNVLTRLHALSVAFERNEPEQLTKMIPKLAFEFPIKDMKDLQEKSTSNALKVTAEEHNIETESFLN